MAFAKNRKSPTIIGFSIETKNNLEHEANIRQVSQGKIVRSIIEYIFNQPPLLNDALQQYPIKQP